MEKQSCARFLELAITIRLLFFNKKNSKISKTSYLPNCFSFPPEMSIPNHHLGLDLKDNKTCSMKFELEPIQVYDKTDLNFNQINFESQQKPEKNEIPQTDPKYDRGKTLKQKNTVQSFKLTGKLDANLKTENEIKTDCQLAPIKNQKPTKINQKNDAFETQINDDFVKQIIDNKKQTKLNKQNDNLSNQLIVENRSPLPEIKNDKLTGLCLIKSETKIDVKKSHEKPK